MIIVSLSNYKKVVICNARLAKVTSQTINWMVFFVDCLFVCGVLFVLFFGVFGFFVFFSLLLFWSKSD